MDGVEVGGMTMPWRQSRPWTEVGYIETRPPSLTLLIAVVVMICTCLVLVMTAARMATGTAERGRHKDQIASSRAVIAVRSATHGGTHKGLRI